MSFVFTFLPNGTALWFPYNTLISERKGVTVWNLVHIQSECTRPDFFHAFPRSFSVGGTNLLSGYTCICCLNKHLLVQQLGLGGWRHFHLQNTILENTILENTVCMKVAGRGRRVVFHLLKKYFLLNYCYHFFITVHRTGAFLGFCLFFLLLRESVVHLI